jgi:2-polyprenyl-6-methoxyphenol hydroxylase-like FAD-dependent oxidoreductase
MTGARYAYDLIVIGGGIAGCSLAKVMAEHGARVLVLEKEKQFKDRVRGDAMAPWGVPEARILGIYDVLHEMCGHDLPWVQSYLRGIPLEHRELPTTTTCGTAEFAFYHPEMQEVVLGAAEDAGAEVRRGATAERIERNGSPTVEFTQDARVERLRARLVVGADGRMSRVRRLADFAVQQDPAERMLAGVLLADMDLSEDTSYAVFDPDDSQLVALFPLGAGRVRAYFSYRQEARERLQGAEDVPRLVAASQQAGAPAEWYREARAIGPLASFASDDQWVEHPYRDGVVLIGDAAATNDPMYGQGLSLSLRDVRVLWQQLIAQDDWSAACHAYAAEHDAYFGALHTFSHWFEKLFYATGAEADLVRERVLPLLFEDRERMPDFFFSGPEPPLTEAMRRRMFGEDF